MFDPIKDFRLTSFPSLASFLRESRLSCSSGSDAFSGSNHVWMTNTAAVFARFIQYLLSTVMVIILLMNPSIDASLASMLSARGSYFARWYTDWRLSSSWSRFLCGEWISVVPHKSSLSRSFTRYIADFLIVVNSSGVGVVPKVHRR